MTLDDLATWLVAAAALPATLFPILYHVFAPWRTTDVGRDAMYLSLCIAAFLNLALWIRVFGDFSWRTQFAVCLYGVLVLLCWRRLWLMMHGQIQRRSNLKESSQ